VGSRGSSRPGAGGGSVSTSGPPPQRRQLPSRAAIAWAAGLSQIAPQASHFSAVCGVASSTLPVEVRAGTADPVSPS